MTVSAIPFLDKDACDRKVFLDAMSKAATSVAIVTSDGVAGRAGRTVSSLASVSADPPMLLFCIHNQSPFASMISANGVFCLNLLRHEQWELANVFAGRAASGARHDFDRGFWVQDSFAPRLSTAVASFTCSVTSVITAGTHSIFIGAVDHVNHGEGEALVYAGRNYASATPLSFT